MHRYLLFGFLENLDTVPHQRLGKLFGVTISATPLARYAPLASLGLGLLVSAGSPAVRPAGKRPIDPLLYAVAFATSIPVHSLGHLLGGKLVGSPMDELLLTSFREVTYYHQADKVTHPWHVHIGRALGGPLANLALSRVCARAARSAPEGLWRDAMTIIGAVNARIGLGTLAPVPMSDGIVIAGTLLGEARRRGLPARLMAKVGAKS